MGPGLILFFSLLYVVRFKKDYVGVWAKIKRILQLNIIALFFYIIFWVIAAVVYLKSHEKYTRVNYDEPKGEKNDYYYRQHGNCDMVKNQKAKDFCWEKKVVDDRKPRFCELIKDEKIRNNCYFGVAIRTNEVKYCAKISKEKEKSRCYVNIVNDYKVDSSICDLSPDPESCFAEYFKDNKYYHKMPIINPLQCSKMRAKEQCLKYLNIYRQEKEQNVISSIDKKFKGVLREDQKENFKKMVFLFDDAFDDIVNSLITKHKLFICGNSYCTEKLSQEVKNAPKTMLDSDNDLLPDNYEVILKTDKNNKDSDGDGYLDGEEIISKHDPLKTFK